MSLKFNKGKVADGGREFTPISSGIHTARIVQIADVGVHAREFQGVAKEPASQLVFTFEVQEDGDAKLISKQVVVSDFYGDPQGRPNSGLVDIFLAATGKVPSLSEGLDVETLLGAPVMLTIVKNKNNRSTIKRGGITGVPRGTAVPAAQSELLIFDFDNPDLDVKEKLFGFAGNLIDQALGTKGAGSASEDTETGSDF